MKWSRGRIALLVVLGALWLVWGDLSRSVASTAVLHIPPTSRSQDTYVHLWLVEGRDGLWIRAERPTRLWLPYLEDAPIVELTVDGETRSYRAVVDDTEWSRSHVDSMFRREYGLADVARTPLRSTTVPIRLVQP